MGKIRLFIENKEVELTDDIQFAITKQFSDLENPTTIINDWSKTVDIPFTQNNNKLFGDLYKTDRARTASNGIGINFDPTKKNNFMLLDGDNIIMTGYSKMQEIKRDGLGNGFYSINLFGNIGNVLSELKKISFEDKEDLYYTGEIAKTTITKETVYDCWNDEWNRDKFYYRNNEDYNNTIGFATCNQGFNENFDSKTYETRDDDDVINRSYVETLDKKIADNNWKISSSIIEEGILPRTVGEYRNRYQVPFVYVPKLFSILSQECKKRTGYNMFLSPDWFNEENPYYAKYIMTLNRPSDYQESGYKTIADVDGKINNLYYSTLGDNGNVEVNTTVGARTQYFGTYRIFTDQTGGEHKSIENVPMSDFKTFPIYTTFTPPSPTKHLTLIFNNTFRIISRNIIFSINNIDYHLTNRNDIDLTLTNGYVISYVINNNVIERDLLCLKNSTIDKTGYDNVIYEYDSTPSTSFWTADLISKYQYDETVGKEAWIHKYLINIYHKVKLNIADYYVNEPFRIGIKVEQVNDTPMLVWKTINGTVPTDLIPYFPYTLQYDTTKYFAHNSFGINTIKTRINNRVLTGSPISLNSLWDKTYSLFDVCVNYTKMFNMVWTIDDINKTIYCIPKYKFFKDYKIEDWTDKINYNKEFNIKPLITDNKYLLFNYDKATSSIAENYKNMTSYNFGEQRIDTGYSFGDNTKKLFSNIGTAICNNEMLLDWKRLSNNGDTAYYNFEGEDFPNFQKNDKNDKSFGLFMFNNGKKAFDTNMIPVYISDDSKNQIDNDSFCYIDKTYGESAGLSIKTDCFQDISNYVIYNSGDEYIGYYGLFGLPAVIYTFGEQGDTKHNIYSLFWKSYIEDLYSKNTHILTCYVKLSNIDFSNFKFNTFVKVENCIYLVNKIYDFNPNEQFTKCDLIKINDINNYIDIFSPENHPWGTYLLLSCNDYNMYDFTSETLYAYTNIENAEFTYESSNSKCKVYNNGDGSFYLKYEDPLRPSVLPFTSAEITVTCTNRESGFTMEKNMKIHIGPRPIDDTLGEDNELSE